MANKPSSESAITESAAILGSNVTWHNNMRRIMRNPTTGRDESNKFYLSSLGKYANRISYRAYPQMGIGFRLAEKGKSMCDKLINAPCRNFASLSGSPVQKN